MSVYLQLPGAWGWSNCGVVNGDDESVLVDTLFDLPLTRSMLAGAPAGPPIRTVINTHANGDHCYGNSALPSAVTVATSATASAMDDLPPSALAAMVSSATDDDLGRWVRHAFGAFDFAGSPHRPADETFVGTVERSLGGRDIRVAELGPAHTASDAVVFVPDAGVVFAGDLWFAGCTPIAWAGPLSGWVDACRRIQDMRPDVVVPGHGAPGRPAALDAMCEYLVHVETESEERLGNGMGILEAALDIDLGPFALWGERERIVANVATVHRHLGLPDPWDAGRVLAGMAAYWAADPG